MSKRGLGSYDELAGNSVGSHAAYVRSLVRGAENLLSFEDTIERMFEEEIFVLGFSVKLPNDDRPEYLAVVRISVGGEKKVGFHNALTLGDLVIGVANRLRNRSFQWKDDEYE